MFSSIFTFYSKKIRCLGPELQIDMHAHWLPGLDDGAKTLEESIAMIDAFVEAGYSELIATPHVYSDYYPNTNYLIKQAFHQVQEKVNLKYPFLKLGYAAEYFLDDYFRTLVSQKEVLTFRGNHVLVEQSYIAETPGIRQLLFDMQIKGYQPVMAHPERYVYYHSRDKTISELRDIGVKMQINLLSFAGKYGKKVSNKAINYLQKGWVDFIGTDAHTIDDILKVRNLEISEKTYDLLSKVHDHY